MKIKSGIHTFCLTQKVPYNEITNICQANNDVIKYKTSDMGTTRTYHIYTYKKIGVEIILNQSLVYPSNIKMIINPSSLLANTYDETGLFKATKSNIKILYSKLKTITDKIGLKSLDKFKLSRCDITEDRYYDTQADVMFILNVFKKSLPIRYYNPKILKNKTDNNYYWEIASDTCQFSVYNKTYELKKRHNIKIYDNILRMEYRLERKNITKICKCKYWKEQLNKLYKSNDKILSKFLHRLHQDNINIVTKSYAIEQINSSKYRKNTKKELIRIIKKASSCETLAATQKQCRIKRSKFIKLLKKISDMGFNAVTRD